MRELDELLLNYLANRYPDGVASEKAAFRRLLTLSDAELMSYLLRNDPPPPDLACVIDALCNRAQS